MSGPDLLLGNYHYKQEYGLLSTVGGEQLYGTQYLDPATDCHADVELFILYCVALPL